jgi:5-formyltetrahydrofolate cyclo-ligase
MAALNSTDTISGQKQRLREEALARRDAMPAAERQAAAESIAGRKFPVEAPPGAIVSGFMPMKSEINPLPLLKRLAAEGARLALPVVAGRGNALIMRLWEFGAPLEPGAWDIRQPKSDAPEADPDILLVPLAAFDRAGHRIGYGAGYYDLTINRLREIKPITAIGIAFAAQEIPRVPATERDARLDFMLTEREVIDLRG